MPKIIISFLFVFLFHYSYSQIIATDFSDTVYEYFKDIFEGIAGEKNDTKCVEVITKNKDDFMRHIRPIIDSINDTSKLFNSLVEHGLKLLTIHGFAKNCKLLNVIIFYNRLTNLEEIKILGNTTIKLKREIAGIFNKTKSGQVENSLFYKIGKLAQVLLDLKIK